MEEAVALLESDQQHMNGKLANSTNDIKRCGNKDMRWSKSPEQQRRARLAAEEAQREAEWARIVEMMGR
jgi:hypothetical protein